MIQNQWPDFCGISTNLNILCWETNGLIWSTTGLNKFWRNFFSLILLPFHDILRTFFYKNRKRRWIKKENAPSEINPTNCVKHNSVRVVFEHYICCVNWCSILFIVMMTLGHQSTNRIILARFKLVTIKFWSIFFYYVCGRLIFGNHIFLDPSWDIRK